ncbi:uncharacterized protein DUF262 [Sinobacterium caligoides]|uniref:Uncharacterized protein DUF262 n=1 Tax=Sinobacterium caligoides TaxID=933926 RepID=A0A3N2E223_9GAMM|nr:DUF262 domain-containing protein [Sinobacterium caligoides]ROS05739.1 uncharacterized protein DUF262 [Sinobacterium caligoides]
MSNLIDEFNNARLKVQSDQYPMSIGELSNLYDDGDLDIHPDFQRIYRWSSEQKSKLIESILLSIPLPSIFVSQREDGVWDVVDGVQRISTILSFMGKLKDSNGEIQPALELESTKYLPSLKGKKWSDDSVDGEIDQEIKRVFKREKIDIKIIKRESEDDTKFELFQRLNTGGSKLSDQEVRNCMLLMLNANAYNWLKGLAEDKCFLSTTPVSERQKRECYGQELALRFFVQRFSSEEIRAEHKDIGAYISAEMNRLLSKDSGFDFDKEEELFKKTFKLIDAACDESAFKKYNHIKERYEGAVSVTVYEAVAAPVSVLIEKNSKSDEEIIELIRSETKALTNHDDYKNIIEKSVRPVDRMIRLNKLGKELIC